MASHDYDATSLSLLHRARRDDQQAWGQIVHLYGPLVHRWCRRAGLGEDDTADVFQETFRAVSGNLQSFAPQKSVGSFRCWLRSIVRTKIADQFRRCGRQPQAAGGTTAQLLVGELPDALAEKIDADEDANEEALVVQRAMELIRPEFEPRNWNSFWQVAVEGRSAVDVAAELDVSPQVVRQANYRIRRRLRLVLQDLMDDAP